MHPAKRRRVPRDSAENIYRNCIHFGTCPPDVVNKIEGKTVADKILQWGSAGVFLGNLGISTGKGSANPLGYVPLGRGGGVGVGAWPRPGLATRPVVPTAPIEAVGPIDVGPAVVDPAVVDPVLIEMEPILPRHPEVVDEIVPIAPSDPSVISDNGVYPAHPAVIDESLPTGGGRTVEVVAEVHHPADYFPVHPIDTGGSDNPAIIDVGEDIPLLPRTSTPHHTDPAILHATTSFGTSAEVGGARYTVVDFEATDPFVVEEGDIPLQVYDREADLEFRTSTPKERTNPIRKVKALYNRFVKQVPVEDPLFLTAPGELVEYGFQNPAYDPDETIEFSIDTDQPTAAPDSRFRDVHTLHRQILGEAPTGHVRVSRVGSVAAMRTRSGATVGPQLHLYKDISSIGEAIELQPLSYPHASDSSTYAVMPADTSFGGDVAVGAPPDVSTEVSSLEEGFEEVPLLQDHSGQQQTVGVSRGGSRDRQWITFEIPTPRTNIPASASSDRDIFVYYPDESQDHDSSGEAAIDTDITPARPIEPISPVGPSYVESTDSFPYWLAPSLQRKKRKRKTVSFCSLADGCMDS
ncbi:L2 [Eidolon helvum papillomavirus 3]|uniref:Minor capsid protein L2 n=1 Tax=Eidolon helvum papillomavirus 3 TaxID=1335477 RepID=A0A1P8YVV6_9PAPI|nr:L2 [Eidolon helvum papillomavirus 3]AQA28213.1 L2 [Eidolon helvum papillomavirus 3]